jgi:PAS domain S-box-containing protein
MNMEDNPERYRALLEKCNNLTLALSESEERLKSIAEGMAEGLLIVENDRVVFANRRACDIFGYPEAELMSMGLFDMTSSSDRARLSALVEETRGKGYPPKEAQFWIKRKNGERACVLNRYSNIEKDDQVTGWYIMTTDVTRRVQREAELEIIAWASSAFRTLDTRQEILPVILNQVRSLMNVKGLAILFQNPLSGEVVVELANGSLAGWSGYRILPGAEISAQVAASGKPYFNDNPAEETNFAGPESSAGMAATACLPFQAEGQTLGLLWVEFDRLYDESDRRILTSLTELAGGALYRAAQNEQTQRRIQRLAALRSIDMTITASLDLRVTLDILINQAITHLNVDAASVLIFKSHTRLFEYMAGHGLPRHLTSNSRFQMGRDPASRAAYERRIIHCPNLNETTTNSPRIIALTTEGFVAYYAVPLITRGEIKGILEILHRSDLHTDTEWQEFLETLASQAAIAIDSAEMFQGLQRSNMELVLAYDNTLEGWVRTLDMRDKETEGHTQRVTVMTLRLATAMDIPDHMIVHVRRGALLHDIGKIAMPDSILLKRGALTPEEWVQMRKHPEYAYELLSPIPYLSTALEIPLYHHERWDGAGYPHGLKGEQIPLAARIFAVVDVWDALQSDRPYRAAWPKKKVIAHLKEQSGQHFDPQVAACFLGLLEADRWEADEAIRALAWDGLLDV